MGMNLDVPCYINFSCNCVGEQAWETSALRLNAN